MIQPNDIHTLTDFKRNADGLVERIVKSRRPHVLTVEGAPRFVVQDAAAYQELVEELEALRMRFSRSVVRATTNGGRR
ncbi:MAG: type II toxin-antitoxin system Phd/YefM family antitoxin [Planctomycetes bacterium]|nr:type II toxin-antitoxin system Phd/YefM family antitoxin [Planctomycetota bacterium]